VSELLERKLGQAGVLVVTDRILKGFRPQLCEIPYSKHVSGYRVIATDTLLHAGEDWTEHCELSCSCSRPAGVVVSMLSRSERNATWRCGR
jgi:hypothetical protein